MLKKSLLLFNVPSNFEWLQKVQDIDFDISLLFIALSTGGLSVFLFCFYGKMATQSYEQIYDALCEYNWHELPIGLQKYILFMMLNIQKPLRYRGFIFALDLETFSKVSTFSLYLWMKSFLILYVHWQLNKFLFFYFYWKWQPGNILFKKLSIFFQKTMKTVITYYMMFKTITANWRYYPLGIICIFVTFNSFFYAISSFSFSKIEDNQSK